MTAVQPSPRRTAPAAAQDGGGPEPDPLWYKDAIIYEVHVRAFFDSDANGVGDFRGLTSKLDYLHDLGITAIWLLPFYPSPLRDDGYDIADYTAVNPDYGTLRDVRTLIAEAHRRGLRVITELVCNHTSDQHPWFQRARRAPPGSPERDYYVWSDTPERYQDARIIFKDTETSNWAWDPVANAYYWHRFFSHQPDLNYRNPRVKQAVFKAMDFWLDMGVDGLRLDAVPYLFEAEGTNCENLPETHEFLRELRARIDERYPDKMLLAEANQWPEDSVAYLGKGDECHMAFHFPVMPRMFMAIRMEDRFPIVDILGQTPPIPETAQWALFLRNHDELTLEMVTDEERDYMYRVYANDPQARINVGIRRRLAPLLENNRRRIELMNGLLFSLPGTPVLYYGDEIGMGDNVYLGDRNGVRTPMQWSGDRNAGFSTANRQALYFPVVTDPEYHYEAINVETQQANPASLLWWMKRLIALRKRHPAFGRGSLEFLRPANRKVLAFLRILGDERILVVANLSRFSQPVELDLSAFAGQVPREMFGSVEFPTVGDGPYALTLSPHGFMWFTLEAPGAAGPPADGAERRPPVLQAPRGWQALLGHGGGGAAPAGARLPAVAAVLTEWARGRRWFRGKARGIVLGTITDVVMVPVEGGTIALAFLVVSYRDGDPEEYCVPLGSAEGEAAERLLADSPGGVIARLDLPGGGPGVLYDGFLEPGLSTALVDLVATRRRLRGRTAELAGTPTRQFRALRGPRSDPLVVNQSRGEQSNSSAILSERLMLKLFRRIDSGINPDLEMARFLTDRGFPNVAPVAGFVSLRHGESEPGAVAMLQKFAENDGDGWTRTLDGLATFVEHALASADAAPVVDTSVAGLLGAAGASPPELAQSMVAAELDRAWLLGTRTAELHAALAGDHADPAFAPQPFSPNDQRSFYQSLRNQARRTLQLVADQLARLPPDGRVIAEEILAADQQIEERYRALLDSPLSAVRIRVHGDYHLGQVLWAGRDIVIIDFEGEPAKALGERRRKRSAMVDLAGMVRSYHYAAQSVLVDPLGHTGVRPEDRPVLEPWLHAWYAWMSAAFLRGYRETAGAAAFVPRNDGELGRLLDALLLDKAIGELGYELNNRPDWARVPLLGIQELLRS